MNNYGFINLGRIRRAHNEIVNSIRIVRPLDQEEEEENDRMSRTPPLPGENIRPVDIEDAAIPFEGGIAQSIEEGSREEADLTSGRLSEGSNSLIYDEEEGESLEGEEEYYDDEDDYDDDDDDDDESLEIMVDPTREELEEMHYEELSPDFNVMVNTRFNPRKDYNSQELWEVLQRLALPETKRYLIRYVRHCTFAAEQWLVRILQWYHRRYKKDHELPRHASYTERRCPAIPPTFESTFRPILEDIVRKVRHRRWRCSVSKKYIDSLCMYTLCPAFTYDVIRDPEETKGQLRVHISNRLPGDPFRRVSKEINVSRDDSSESLELVPLLWQLELRLIALLYMDSDWINDSTTVRYFPQLCDSRVLFSIYRKQECDRPILSYNVSQVRSALGRLYHRWNDLAPSRDLYHYFCFLRDRVSLLSFSSLQSTIQRKFNHTSKMLDGQVRWAGDGRSRSAAKLPRTRPSRSPPRSKPQKRSIPVTIDPKYAFGQYVGKNLKATVERVTKSTTDDLDELLIRLHTNSTTNVNTNKTRITRSSFSENETKEMDEGDDDDGYAMEVEERLRKAEERETLVERLAISRRIKIYKRLTRKQRLRETISAQIANDRDNAFDVIAEEGDYRTTRTEEGSTKENSGHDLPFLGDTHEEPSVVRKALRKLGEDIFSSSEEDDEFDDYDDDDVFNGDGIARRGDGSVGMKKKKKRKKKDGPELSTASGSHATRVNIAPTDEDFFHNYANLDDGRMYAQLGQMIKDEDICAEVTTHHLIACISNNLSGTDNHPRVGSDIPVHFSDAFLSSLTTDTFLTEQKSSEKTKQVKCITRTNDSFLLETHALMSQIEQEIQTWNLLYTLSIERKHDGLASNLREKSNDDDEYTDSRVRWISRRDDDDDDENSRNNSKFSLTLDFTEFSGNEDEALLEYGIEFERCKIENVLMMCYSFSRGKRNQFISRNVREEAFCHFLNPGEAELLLCVCGLKNSSVVPSIIVSRLRQNDVDRLAKIIDEMTIYGVIEEFANFNHLSIRDRNIASHKHAKHIFESTCLMNTSPETPNRRKHDETHRGTEDINVLMRQLMQFTIRDALDVHLEHNLRGGLNPMLHENIAEDTKHAEDKKIEYSIFANRETLRKMYQHDHNHRFLSPDISVPWQSPRGLTRVIRVLLVRCINFFMKEINHVIDARAFFFNPWMTIRLCNNLSFITLLNIREDLLRQDEEENDESIVTDNSSVEEHPSVVEEDPSVVQEDEFVVEEEEEEHSSIVPTRAEIASLFSTTNDSSSEYDDDDHDDDDNDDERVSSMEMHFVRVPFTPEFSSAMRTRMENYCMDFYHRCPVVLHCMTGCFLWNPSTCTTEECIGADSLLGLHTWLYHMMRHISIHLIPELLVHNTLYLETSKSHSWRIDRNQLGDIVGNPYPVLWSDEEKMKLFARVHSVYKDSSYLDGGMHYTHLLMLLANMPYFGNRGNYCTLIQHVCTFVVQMNLMLFPHILECFSIHNEEAPPADKTTLPDTEESGSGIQPVDRTIQYYEPKMCDNNDDDDDDGMGDDDDDDDDDGMDDEFVSSIGIFCPRPSTT